VRPEGGVTRRGVLMALGVVAAGGGIALWLGRRESVGSATGDAEFALELKGIASDPDALRLIGAAYLAAVPEERSEAALSAALFSSSAWRGIDPDAAAEQLRIQVREDFEAGRTIEIEGWLLALTEARFCALVELLTR